jgi:hypothetical protein
MLSLIAVRLPRSPAQREAREDVDDEQHDRDQQHASSKRVELQAASE